MNKLHACSSYVITWTKKSRAICFLRCDQVFFFFFFKYSSHFLLFWKIEKYSFLFWNVIFFLWVESEFLMWRRVSLFLIKYFVGLFLAAFFKMFFARNDFLFSLFLRVGLFRIRKKKKKKRNWKRFPRENVFTFDFFFFF